MAVSARLWFNFYTAIGRFPAALNLFLPMAINRHVSMATLPIEQYSKQTFGKYF